MKKNKLLNIMLLSVFIFMCIGIKNSVYATGSFSVKASKTSVNVGDTVTISVTGSNAYGQVNISATNASLSSSSVFLQNDTKTVTLTANSVGTIIVTVSPSSAGLGDSDENPITGSKSVSITVQGSSSNGGSSSSSSSSSSSESTSNSAALSMISTSPVDFSGFKSNVYKYYVTVENSVTEIGVTAKGKNGSTYSVSGNKNLQEGTNKVTVTAKNGSNTQNYYIYVTRKTANNEEVIPNEIDEEKEEEKQTLRLENLVLDDTLNVKLDPNFDPEVFEYTVILGNDYLDLEELYINAIPNIDGANITIEGNKNLIDGENIVTITVEAEGYETVTYTIKVIKVPVEEVEETVARVINTDEDILDNSGEILKKRIIICVLTLLIALIGIIFIAKECYESTNNTQNKEDNKKEKRAKKSYENDEFFENNYNEEIEFEENNILADIYNKNKSKETENEVKEAEEIEKNEEDKEDETIKGKTESISNEDFFNRRIDIYEEKPRRRRGKGKHC